jgi:hypothetical protein
MLRSGTSLASISRGSGLSERYNTSYQFRRTTVKINSLRYKLSLLALVPILLAAFAIAPAVSQSTQAAGNPHSPLQNIPVAGTIVGGGTFQGTLSVVNFANNNGALAATGLLSGTLLDAAGHTIGSVADQLVTLPASLSPANVCRILDLTLGPLDLTLLGLNVHLDTVHLTITATPGPGNLLGNLLCAVSNLLNGPPPLDLNAVVGLLNRVIGMLGG